MLVLEGYFLVLEWKENIKNEEIYQSVNALRNEGSVAKFERGLAMFRHDWLNDARARILFHNDAIR